MLKEGNWGKSPPPILVLAPRAGGCADSSGTLGCAECGISLSYIKRAKSSYSFPSFFLLYRMNDIFTFRKCITKIRFTIYLNIHGIIIA